MKKNFLLLSNYFNHIGLKHTIRIMKTTTAFALIVAFQLNATSLHSQSAKVNINKNNLPLKEFIQEVEKQTDYLFMYSEKEINLEKEVHVNAKNKPVSKVLQEVFNNSGIEYNFNEGYISLSTTKKEPIITSVNQSEKKVSGLVKDANGDPVIGANIAIKGTSMGTITDIDGRFTLNTPEKASLIVSYIGYLPQEIVVGNQSNLTITLKEDTQNLDEVVVVGFGSVKKTNLTSSVAKITDEAVKERPITTLGEAFQGQLAGVRSSSTGGGVPGSDLQIRIRGMNTINGSSDPLYVIDGVPRDNMTDLNPTDIASIQILKDASATSIYGARGANGVVLIETKKGQGKPTITFDAYYGVSNREKKLDMMSGEEWVAYNTWYRNLAHLRTGGSMSDPMSSRLSNNQVPASWASTTQFTDWQDAVLQTAQIQNYQVSASSKGDIGNIYFSAGYMGQDGIIKYTDYERINARMNATMNISKKLRAGVNFSVSHSDANASDANKGGNGGGKESPLHHAIMCSPLLGLDEGYRDGKVPENIGQIYPNPLKRLEYITDNNKALRLMASIFGEYDIIDGLTFKTQYSFNYDNNIYQFFAPNNLLSLYGDGITAGNSNVGNTRSWVFQNTLTYDKTFKDVHHLNVLIGQSAEERKGYSIYANATGWPYETLETLNLAKTPTGASTNRSTYATASFFGRASYDYKEKYLLTASVRYDGSSRFGSNKKMGVFPSFSAGWKINEEAFMDNFDWLSLLKLRGAWGVAGNDRIGDYAYMAMLGTYNTTWGDKVVSGVAPNRIANEDLQWEQTKTLDFGVDFSAFKNRVQLNFDYYVNTTDNLLFSVPIPYTTGFSSFQTNLGSIRNKGWELDITTHNITGKFNWTSSLNLSRNRNKVLDMGDIDQFTSTSWDAQFITKVGGPVSQYYVYRTDGVLLPSDFDENGKAKVPTFAGQEEGNVKYVDQNKDGVLNSEDLVPYGNNLPDVVFGFTNRFSWNGFDLSVLLQGQIGGDVLFLGSRHYDAGGANLNIMNRWLHSYKPDYEKIYGASENPIPVDYLKQHGIDMSWDGKTPNQVGVNQNNDDRRIYSTTYLRIKNVTLGYTLPKQILANTILNSVRFYVSLDNLVTFDSYPGFTPETNTFGNATTMMGVDYSTYPLSRRAIIGASVVF